jgi:hypothetical protein
MGRILRWNRPKKLMTLLSARQQLLPLPQRGKPRYEQYGGGES